MIYMRNITITTAKSATYLENVGQESITGPVAGAIALAAVAIAGGMLIFGGELNDFARRLMYVVLVAGILLGATQIVGLFGAGGASIGVPEQVEALKPVPGGPANG